MSTLTTYATEGALPVGTTGDIAYVTGNDQLYVNDGGTWFYWGNSTEKGISANDLAYTGAKTGNPESGTNYVCSVQPEAHYDAAKINGEDATGNPAIGQVMGGTGYEWEDRSGNGNDATQGTATYQSTYFHNQGNYGLEWPVNTDGAFLNTNYSQAADSPGHTVVAAASVAADVTYAGLVTNDSSSGPISATNPSGLSVRGTRCNVTHQYFGASMGTSTSYQRNARLTTVFSCVAIDGDQKLFYNLDEIGTASTAYSTGTMDGYLDGDYLLGEGFHSWGSTDNNGGGGIIYEVLIFRGNCGYTSAGGALTDGNLKIVVDYLMNKYRIL